MGTVGFFNDEYYHIYNRGTDKRKIFLDVPDYLRFFKSLEEFNALDPKWKQISFRGETSDKSPIVDIVAYCLNPNHFHLILKQKADRGITEFMRRLGTGHTMYFNKRYERSGVLFQGKFKAVPIDSNDQLLYVSAYVNCNSEIHDISPSDSYRWCSFKEYYEGKKGIATGKEIILGQFKKASEYRDYAIGQVPYMRQRKELEE